MTTKKTTSKKKTAAKKAVAKKTAAGTSLARPEDVRASLAKYAKAAAASEKHSGGGSFISTKNGEYTYQGDALDNPLRAVVVDFAHVNAYYEGAFDPNSPATPVCFAIAKSPEDPDEDVEHSMAPHPDAADPQAETCRECWANAWKSADNGRGKACKNMRRLALVAAGVDRGEGVETSLEGVDANAEVAMLNLPPSALKYWGGFTKKLANVMGLPPFAVVTDLEIEDLDTGYTIKPTVVEELPDETIAEMMALREAVADDLTAPYQAQPEAEAPAPRRGKKRTAAKKTASKKTASKKARAKF